MDMMCKVEDDVGHLCSNRMSKKEKKQDGMCSRCAELLWNNYAQPAWLGKPDKPVIFKDNYRGHTTTT